MEILIPLAAIWLVLTSPAPHRPFVAAPHAAYSTDDIHCERED